MRVAEAMTRDIVTVRPETPLKEAARIMSERGISGLPVVDGEGRLLGVLSESDFVHKEIGGVLHERRPGHRRLGAPALEAKLRARVAGDAMTSPAITIHPDYSLADAARLMVERGVNRMPVVQDGRLLGILTRADLVHAFARGDDGLSAEIHRVLRALMVPLGTVSVTVEEGEVWLAGELDTAARVKAVANEVSRVVGVVAVHSKLTAADERSPDA